MKDKADMQTRPEAYVCESVCGGIESVCACTKRERRKEDKGEDKYCR